MKLLTNTSRNVHGGIEKNVAEFRRYFSKKENSYLSTIVVTSENGCEEQGNIFNYSLALPKVISPHLVYEGVKTAKEFREKMDPLIKQIQKIIREQKIDVVFLQGTFYTSWSAMQAALEMNLPVVERYAGVLAIEEKDEPSEERRQLYRDLENSFNDERIFTIFPSNLTQKTVQSLYGHPKGKFVIIPNGISQEFFKGNKKTSKEKACLDIGFVSRFHEIKNPEFVFAFSDYLSSNFINSKVHFVTNVSAPKDSPKNLCFYGAMSPDSLRDFYQMMDFVLSPSHFETFGNVPLESLASGTPPIISKKMGVKEVFQELDLGFLIGNFQKKEQIARLILGLREKKLDFSSFKNKLQKDFSWQNIIGKMFQVCEDFC